MLEDNSQASWGIRQIAAPKTIVYLNQSDRYHVYSCLLRGLKFVKFSQNSCRNSDLVIVKKINSTDNFREEKYS